MSTLSSTAIQQFMSGSRVDNFSSGARQEMHDILQELALAYAERWDLQTKQEERSVVSEYHLQEGIGQLGLAHPLFSYMNIACIGHPFLQYDAYVTKAFLKKYGIKMGHTYIWKRGSTLLNEFMKFVTDYPRCGGDSLKTAEAAQWILFYPKSVAFLGTCGGDADTADIYYHIHETNLAYKLEKRLPNRTSLQLVVRYKKRWSEIHICDREASTISLRFIDTVRVSTLLERAQIIFICGRSFLLSGMKLSHVAYFASSRLKTLCFQLCDGIYLNGMEKEFLDVVQNLDLFFLSRRTALMLIEKYRLPGCFTPTRLLTLGISKWVHSVSSKMCTIIVYVGIRKAYVATGTKVSTVKKYNSKFYSTRNIVDMYGCESAFAGGYLAQLVQRSEIKPCIDCAFFCASAVATQQGARFPINRLELLILWLEKEEEALEDVHRENKTIFSSVFRQH